MFFQPLVKVLILVTVVGCGKDGREEESDPPSVNLEQESSRIYGIDSRAGWKNLPVLLQIDGKFSPLQKKQIFLAMQTWNEAAGIELLRPSESTEDLEHPGRGIYDYLKSPTNSLVLLQDWCVTHKAGTVLGSTVWENAKHEPDQIVSGDVFLNATYDLVDTLDPTLPVAEGLTDLQSLALHELGHFLGLSHNREAASVMRASLKIW